MYHVIKQETGKSLKELVNEIRLADARNLLEHSSFQIGQIADYCGFSTNAYFFPRIQKRVRHDAAGIPGNISTRQVRLEQAGEKQEIPLPVSPLTLFAAPCSIHSAKS